MYQIAFMFYLWIMITNKNEDLGKRSAMAKGNSNSAR